MGFPGGSDGKESAHNAGDPGSIPGSGRSPGEGNGNPLQYSCLENSMDRGAWQATVHGVTKSWTRLSDSRQDHICRMGCRGWGGEAEWRQGAWLTATLGTSPSSWEAVSHGGETLSGGVGEYFRVPC